MIYNHKAFVAKFKSGCAVRSGGDDVHHKHNSDGSTMYRDHEDPHSSDIVKMVADLSEFRSDPAIHMGTLEPSYRRTPGRIDLTST